MESNRDRAGYIYLIKALGSNPTRFKIGRTNNIERRLKEIATCNPYPITLIDSFKVEDSVLSEKSLHQKMDKYRVWGEWFLLPHKYQINLDWFLIERKEPKVYPKSSISNSEYDSLINELPF